MPRGKHYDPGKFQRPGVDLDRHGRAWRDVEVQQLLPGDVVKDYGLVNSVDLYDPPSDLLEVEFHSRDRQVWKPTFKVAAFTKPLTSDSN